MDNDINSLLICLALKIMDEPDVQDKIKRVSASESKQKFLPSFIPDKVERSAARSIEPGQTLKQLREVQNKIEELINSKSELLEKVIRESLQSQSSTFGDDNNRLTKENKELLKNNQNLKEEKDKVQAQLDELERKYKHFDAFQVIWDKLNRLDEDTRSYIGNLCGSFSLLSCISLGRDFGKLTQLWQYLKDIAVGATDEDQRVDIIGSYFELCIQMADSCSGESTKYSMYGAEINSEFDREKCIKTANSKQIGTVKRVLVRGVLKNDNIEFKSIVEIG